MTIWFIILGGMLVTYTIRLSFILLIEPGRLPEFVKRSLRYVPPAVLAALIAPEVLLSRQDLTFEPVNPRLLASLFAALVAWRTQNTWLTMGTGVLTFILVSIIFPMFNG